MLFMAPVKYLSVQICAVRAGGVRQVYQPVPHHPLRLAGGLHRYHLPLGEERLPYYNITAYPTSPTTAGRRGSSLSPSPGWAERLTCHLVFRQWFFSFLCTNRTFSWTSRIQSKFRCATGVYSIFNLVMFRLSDGWPDITWWPPPPTDLVVLTMSSP